MFRTLSTKYENSQIFINRLIKKYKPKILPGIISCTEVTNRLKSKYDLIKIKNSEVDPIFWKIGVLGNMPDIDENNCNFYVYKIKKNQKSKGLYTQSLKLGEVYSDEYIIIVIENTSDFLTSNSQKIARKLLLYKGISKEDYDKESTTFINYLRLLRDDSHFS